jgi:UDP-N-acetyl-D-mannosaminuronic acid dehydrogenase
MTTTQEKLVTKIRDRAACIAVVGLGRVGLPTAAVFANAGYRVIGADVKKDRTDIVVSPAKGSINEPGVLELIEKLAYQNKLTATTNVSEAVAHADIIIICVQTPAISERHTNLTYLRKACEATGKGLSPHKLVIIESTVPPRTTRNFIAPILEEKSGLKCGESFWLACCPETMAPGSFLREFVENPRIIGGYNEESAYIASELLRTVTKTEIALTDCTTAEVSKLVGNTFRDVNIAFANELALICEQIGIDVKEVIRLATMHPRTRNIHQPGPGVGGPCLIKDPYLLLQSVKESGFRSKVIKSSRELNNRMPHHIVELSTKALNEVGKDPKSARIAVLGVAYKGDVDDATASPAGRIIRELKRLGSTIVVFDPYSEETFGAKRAETLEEAVMGADCIIVATDHKMFKEIGLSEVKALMNKNPIIVDSRRILNPKEAMKQGFRYSGTGYIIPS